MQNIFGFLICRRWTAHVSTDLAVYKQQQQSQCGRWKIQMYQVLTLHFLFTVHVFSVQTSCANSRHHAVTVSYSCITWCVRRLHFDSSLRAFTCKCKIQSYIEWNFYKSLCLFWLSNLQTLTQSYGHFPIACWNFVFVKYSLLKLWQWPDWQEMTENKTDFISFHCFM